MPLFDSNIQQHRIERAQLYSNEDRFLYRWAEQQVNDRLQDIKREFKNILIISDFDTNLENDLADANTPPYDCVISILSLHRNEDPAQHLKHCLKSLKPDGFFLGLFFGGDTLTELKQSIIHAETSISGGSHQRTTPLMTKQQAGSLLQSAGFALPVIDSDIVQVGYRQLSTLYQDLRAMGETNTLTSQSKTIPPKTLFKKTEEHYKSNFLEHGKYTATFDIIFCSGWSPDKSQQKPLRPGSAQTSLKDVL